MRNFYYDVHVFFSRFDGYSIPVKTDRPMDEEDVIEFARDNDLFTEDGDGNHVDYVEEIDDHRGNLVIGGDDQESIVVMSIEIKENQIVANYGVYDEEGYQDIDDFDVEFLVIILEACEIAIENMN